MPTNTIWPELDIIRNRSGAKQERDLVRATVRLASQNPALKSNLAKVIHQARLDLVAETEAFQAVHARHPAVVTASRWASMTLPEKVAAVRKLAHLAILKEMGLTKELVRLDMAFMVYKIDAGANNSKFYEGLVIEEDNGFRVIRRWGALTDSGMTGRIDGGKFDRDPRFWFAGLSQAKRELAKHYQTRTDHGYVDAFGDAHVSPMDGKKLPMGQYPVGLTRGPSFGWGTQSVTQCIPALKRLVDYLRAAHAEVKATGNSQIITETLQSAEDVLRDVAHADSTMAQKLLKLVGVPLRRAQGSPRFLPDLEGQAMARELFSIINYVTKQTAYCVG